MTAQAVPAPRQSPLRLIAVVSAMLAAISTVVLIGAYFSGHWLLDAQGRPIANDFVNVWAAGRMALEGNAAAAFDWAAHKAMEVQGVGHDFANYYGWHYPPTFLFVAAPLSLMPFLAASLAWLAATLPGYLAAMRAIVGTRAGYLIALGCPAAMWNTVAGQNGFLTASLIGGTLALLEKRPAMAGVLLGLLTYKPQFGLLFPLVLIAGGYWLTIGMAAATALIVAALSWFIFGAAPWLAFAAGLGTTSDAVLTQGLADLNRLQSVFGVVRAHGGSMMLAWSIHITAAAAVAVAVCALWRSRAPYALKAAALCAGTLLVTPYLYMYDLVVLAIAAAFLIRHATRDGFTFADHAALAAAALLLLVYPYATTQVGLAAVIAIAALTAHRVRRALT